MNHHNMALPEHSPQGPFFGPGSPPRTFNNGHPDPQLPPPFPRPMLPPSPQHFQPRYAQPPPPPPPALAQTFGPPNEPRSLPPAPKRPGSSMSISSMLGSDADKPSREHTLNMTQRGPLHHPSTTAPSMSLGAVMSPPQHPSRPSNGEYVYKPRSQTPDRAAFGAGYGVRPHRSSSGTMMQRPGPFDSQPARPMSQTQNPQHGPFSPSMPLPTNNTHLDEAAERQRRTSISGILQRPNSQPQPAPQPRVSPIQPSSFQSPWGYPSAIHPDRGDPNQSNGFPGQDRGPNFGNGNQNNLPRQNGAPGAYDTRPPVFGPPRQATYPIPERDLGGQTHPEPALSQPMSPETRRAVVEPASSRGFGGLLNGHPNTSAPYRSEIPQGEAHPMARQDSAQSQNERPGFGDRVDRGRARFFSPFASSIGQQSQTGASGLSEEGGRKGSDESSHHRAILGLATDSRRGRFSPLPQAVQGAQAQTPVPDAGIKTEHGRVFSGLGGGVANTATTHGSAPPGLSASPFKRDEGLPRLSEDNLMKISRSTPGTSKRPRKLKDSVVRADSDIGDPHGLADSLPGAKRSKHHHHHHHFKVDNVEDLASPLALGQRNTPVSALNPIRRTPTPAGTNSSHPHHHHHHHHRHTRPATQTQPTSSRPKQVARIEEVLKAIANKPRHHLGSFVYTPTISRLEDDGNPYSKLKISIKPPIWPPFDNPEHVNCTYTIRVSRTWLAHDEREAIRAQRFLWGTGIYTDDSDPVVAAMHAGFIKAAFGPAIDTSLFDDRKSSQPTIDGGQENAPEEPLDPPPNMDMHITLLVVPPLEQYYSTGRFGVLSRKWDREAAPHDGVSFMVLNVKFVDEGASRGKGRTGKERKARISASLRDREQTKKKMEMMMKRQAKEKRKG